ncbi:MAG: hypothetical protein WBP64_14595 [Nitrososphaeraceae archaeon]
MPQALARLEIARYIVKKELHYFVDTSVMKVNLKIKITRERLFFIALIGSTLLIMLLAPLMIK